MENDENKNDNIIETNILNNNIFKLDYLNQNYENNTKFIKWNQLMLKEYGNNIKLCKCKIDNILFYISYNKCLEKPPFSGKCPLCNNYICPFCSYSFKKDDYGWRHCCQKRGIYKAFFYFGFKNIKNLEPYSHKDPINYLRFIPGLNSLVLFIKIIDILYLDVAIEESKNNGDNFIIPRERLERYAINFVIILN